MLLINPKKNTENYILLTNIPKRAIFKLLHYRLTIFSLKIRNGIPPKLNLFRLFQTYNIYQKISVMILQLILRNDVILCRFKFSGLKMSNYITVHLDVKYKYVSSQQFPFIELEYSENFKIKQQIHQRRNCRKAVKAKYLFELRITF